MTLGMNNGVVLENNPKWAFHVDNERTELHCKHFINNSLYYTWSEKKNRVLILRKGRGSWKGIGYWGNSSSKILYYNLETLYLRTMYNKCHSLHQGFILPGFILLMFTNYNILCFKLLKPMLKMFRIKWVIKGKMSYQLVLMKLPFWKFFKPL